MFGSKKKFDELQQERDDLKAEVKALTKDRKELKADVEELKLKKKIEDEDIKHMVKMAEEANELKVKKAIMDAEAKKAQDVAQVKDAYRDKMEKFLVKQADDVKDMYSEILKRLPDVSVRFKE